MNAALAGLQSPAFGREERGLLVDALDRWADGHSGPSIARAALDGLESVDPFRELADLELLVVSPSAETDSEVVLGSSVLHERLAARLVGGAYFASMTALRVLVEANRTTGGIFAPDLVEWPTPLAISIPFDDAIHVEPCGAGWRIKGVGAVCLGAVDSTSVLLRATDPWDGVRWLIVDICDADVVAVPSPAAIDGSRPLIELSIDTKVDEERMLVMVDDELVTANLALAIAAESVAITSWCRDTAAEYAIVRQQFGRPIGQFQGVKHHVADLAVAAARAEALLSALETAWESPHRASTVRAASTTADIAVESASTCIQVLGGIGFTWEHDAHLVLRRALQNRQAMGSASKRLVELGRLAINRDPVSNSEHESVTGADQGIARWVIPVLESLGTPEQQERWIPPMRSGQERWCQLFSEPGAGSDLASLSTRAEPDGSAWRLTGQKVWTSRAHEARWGLCLARTSSEPRSRGISCFIVDMHADGVEVRPLRQLTGDSRFNEVFLDGVEVPADGLVGEPGSGWEALRICLAEERRAMASMTFADGGLARLLESARYWVDPPESALERLGERVVDEVVVTAMRSGSMRRDDPSDASLRKLVTMRHRQLCADLALQMLGLAACTPGSDADHWRYAYLDGRGLTIGGGTTEILKNTIAERLLGLPRDPRA